MRPLDYLRRSPIHGVAAFALAGALAAALIASALPVRHEVSVDFMISQRAKPATTDYDYDGYYALRASELFADTIISWFSTPSFIKTVIGTAGQSADDAPLPTRLFRAKRYSSQNVVVRFSAPDPEAGAALAGAVTGEIVKRSSWMNPTDGGVGLFVVEPSEPILAARRIPTSQAAFAGLVLGALGALTFLYLSHGKEKTP